MKDYKIVTKTMNTSNLHDLLYFYDQYWKEYFHKRQTECINFRTSTLLQPISLQYILKPILPRASLTERGV